MNNLFKTVLLPAIVLVGINSSNKSLCTTIYGSTKATTKHNNLNNNNLINNNINLISNNYPHYYFDQLNISSYLYKKKGKKVNVMKIAQMCEKKFLSEFLDLQKEYDNFLNKIKNIRNKCNSLDWMCKTKRLNIGIITETDCIQYKNNIARYEKDIKVIENKIGILNSSQGKLKL